MHVVCVTASGVIIIWVQYGMAVESFHTPGVHGDAAATYSTVAICTAGVTFHHVNILFDSKTVTTRAYVNSQYLQLSLDQHGTRTKHTVPTVA